MAIRRKPPEGNVRRVQAHGDTERSTITSKGGRTVQCESFGEMRWLLYLDRDPKVLDYSSQPEEFEFYDGVGRRHTYVPDFIVWRADGRTEIHEVTRSFRRMREEIVRREEAATRICAGREGWSYAVHTEEDLPDGPDLANLLVLIGWRARAYAEPTVTDACMARLADGRAHPLRALSDAIAREVDLPRGDVVAALGHLLWHGHIGTDLTTLLLVKGEVAPTAAVWLPATGGC